MVLVSETSLVRSFSRGDFPSRFYPFIQNEKETACDGFLFSQPFAEKEQKAMSCQYTEILRGVIGVYAIRNKTTGKAYVGSAAKSMKGRWGDHRKTLRKGEHRSRYLQRAWNKYGEKDFEFVVLEECPAELCVEREQHWIDKLKAANSKTGYNMSPTAGSNLGAKYGPLSEEHRKRIGNFHRELWADPEYKKERLRIFEENGTREKIAASKRGQTLSPKSRRKLSASLKAFYADEERSAATRAKISDASKKMMSDPEMVAKIVAAGQTPKNKRKRLKAVRKAMKKRRGYKWSEEGKAKLSSSLKKYFDGNDEAREKLSRESKERWKDPAIREKLLSSIIGRVMKEETKAKISAANKGLKRSDEARANVSAGLIAAYGIGREEAEKIAELYRGGRSASSLADEFGWGTGTILVTLKRMGEPTRNLQEARRLRREATEAKLAAARVKARQETSERNKRLWADPVWRNKVLESRKLAKAGKP
jgi:group I intron endonuclease